MSEYFDSGFNHPIERIMDTAMARIKALADADTIIGTPVVTPDGKTVMPISKVSMGFVTGGAEYGRLPDAKKNENFPFAGGSGAGVAITPIGFLIDNGSGVKMVSINAQSPYEKILNIIPEVIGSFIEDRKCAQQGAKKDRKIKGKNKK